MKNSVDSQGVQTQFDVLFCIQRAMHRRKWPEPLGACSHKALTTFVCIRRLPSIEMERDARNRDCMARWKEVSPRELAHERTCISLTVDGDCRQSRCSAKRGIEIAWRVRATKSVGACSQKDLSLFPPYDIQVDCGFILGMLKSNRKERTEPTDGI